MRSHTLSESPALRALVGNGHVSKELVPQGSTMMAMWLFSGATNGTGPLIPLLSLSAPHTSQIRLYTETLCLVPFLHAPHEGKGVLTQHT